MGVKDNFLGQVGDTNICASRGKRAGVEERAWQIGVGLQLLAGFLACSVPETVVSGS